MAPLSLGKKKSKTGRRPWAPGRKIDRPPARPGMYFKTTPTRPARAEKRKGRPPTHWACVIKRPGGRPPGPVGGPDHTQTWNTLARRGVDLFTSDLPPDAAEWYQQELRSRAMGYSGYAAEKLEANYGVWPSPETLAHVTKSVYDLKNICN